MYLIDRYRIWLLILPVVLSALELRVVVNMWQMDYDFSTTPTNCTYNSVVLSNMRDLYEMHGFLSTLAICMMLIHCLQFSLVLFTFMEVMRKSVVAHLVLILVGVAFTFLCGSITEPLHNGASIYFFLADSHIPHPHECALPGPVADNVGHIVEFMMLTGLIVIVYGFIAFYALKFYNLCMERIEIHDLFMRLNERRCFVHLQVDLASICGEHSTLSLDYPPTYEELDTDDETPPTYDSVNVSTQTDESHVEEPEVETSF